MSDAPAGLGVLGRLESPFVEQCIARVRALYAPHLQQKKPVSIGSALWDCACDQRDRRFLCLMAKLPNALADRDAAELTPGELASLYLAFVKLRQWVSERDAALDKVVRL